MSRFWSFIRETKPRDIRTILFGASGDRVKVLDTLPRTSTSQADINNLTAFITAAREPVWFLVRCDFEDPSDAQFKLGFTGLPSASTNRFVKLLASGHCGYIPCVYFGSRDTVEDRLWDHLCPISDELEESSSSSSMISAVVEENDRFILIPAANLSELCKNRKLAFVLYRTDNNVLIHAFRPVGVCPRYRLRDSSDNLTPNILRNKNDVIPWLQARMFDSLEFTFGQDFHSCADTPWLVSSAPVVSRESIGRRRSNHNVLSPPTLEKYTGPSKRTRNFPDRLIAN